MKAYWIYACDYGHTWTLFRDEDYVESPEDAICPHKHPHDDPLVPTGREAVTVSKQRMIDAVQVSIRPAARIVDPVKNQIGHEYEFYLVVSDLHAGEERQSKKAFGWNEIKLLLDRFRNLSSAKAWQFLGRIDAGKVIAEQADEADRNMPGDSSPA